MPQGRAGRLLVEIVRQLAWGAAADLAETDEPVDPALIRQLATSVRQLQDAERMGLAYERALEAELARRAAAGRSAAGERGVSAEVWAAIERAMDEGG